MNEERRINPEMIVLAREARGWTQKELADAMSVTQATQSKIESGLLSVGDEYVGRLAKHSGYPDGFFYQTDPVRWSGSGCMYNRKRQSVTVTDYRRLLARVNVLRLNLNRLLHSVEIQTENKFFRVDIAEESATPEEIATLVRGKWNLPPGPIENLTTAIEASGGIVILADFGSVKLDAFSQWPPGMPPMFFVNRLAPPDRCRYTLAHEIGHIVMHYIPTADMEREADRFAAAFLMPREDIIGDLGRNFNLERAAALKQYWKVAMSSLIRRAHDLGRISETQYRRLMTRMSVRGWRTHEPVQISAEEPTVVRSVIDLHLNVHGYSVDELCLLTLTSVGDFERQWLPSSPTDKRTPLRIVR